MLYTTGKIEVFVILEPHCYGVFLDDPTIYNEGDYFDNVAVNED